MLHRLAAALICVATAVPAGAWAEPLCESVAPLLVPQEYESVGLKPIFDSSPARRTEIAGEIFRNARFRGEKLTAVSILCSAARDGDADAMSNLATIADVGAVYVPDAVESFRWRLAAAEKGHARAMAFVGYAYAIGKGVEIDIPAGIAWFRRSAALGDPWGLLNLGDAYTDGLGVPRDTAEGARLRREAAEKGGPAFAARLEARGRHAPDWEEPPAPVP